MPRRRKVGNPLVAAIVGVIIAGMGVYLIVRGTGEVPLVFGILLIVFGLGGSIANLWLRQRFRREAENQRGPGS